MDSRQSRTRAGRLAPSRRWPSAGGQMRGKANYRPMTNMSSRPSRLQEEQPMRKDSTNSSGKNVPLETMPSSTPSDNLPSSRQRYNYHQSSDPKVAADMAVLTKYIQEKNLMSSMMACCQSVLQEHHLPYNPYPEFVGKMRHNAERFHMFAKTTKAIQAQLANKLQQTTTPHIYGVKGYSSAWGLEAIINSISPQALKQYDWLIEDLPPTKIVTSDEQTEYSTLIIFNNCVSEDIRHTITADCPHKILGISVPGSHPGESAAITDTGDFWTLDQARGQWDDFWDAVGDSVKNKQPITIQCLFLLDKEKKMYRAGSKQYILHFVQTSENSSNEKFTSFAKLPYMTLYEGFFLKKAHADGYLMTLKRQEIHGTGSATSTRGTRETRSQRRRSMEDSMLSLQEEERNDGSDLMYANAVTGPITERWQKQIAKLHPVRDSIRLAHLAFLLALVDRSSKSSEVKIELYRYLHSTAASWHAAMSLNTTLQLLAVTYKEEEMDFITQQFMEYRSKLLSTIDPELRARSSEFHVAHSILGKLLLQMLLPDPTIPNKFVVKSLDLRKLRYVQDYCTTLQLVMTEDAMVFFKHIQFQALVSVCREAFGDGDERVMTSTGKHKPDKTVKDSNLVISADSNAWKTMHGVESKEINQQLNKVIIIDEVKSLSNWPRIMVTEAVLMQYMVDIRLDVVWHGYLLELLTGSNLPPNPPSSCHHAPPSCSQPDKTVKDSNLVISADSNAWKTMHGVESKEINQQLNKVIIIDEVKSLSNWPRIMVTEAVLMQYMVDIRLDVVWHGYLLELLTGSNLPPNPVPRLVTMLRQAALRMRPCAETNTALAFKLLLQVQTKLVDRTNRIYGVPSIGAFGLSQHTLAAVDTDQGAFVKVVKLTKWLANKDVVTRRGQFQISVSQAVGQSCALYGRLVPYLNVLHLYEHYYIRGSIGADSDAVQLYAKLVYDYISSIPALNTYAILGVFFDDRGRYMSETDLLADKATFISHTVDAVRKKQDIYLKLYQPIGWRYLCIQKHFVLHYLFVDNAEDRHECYSPDDPSTMYQYVFLSQEEATAHYLGSGAFQIGNIEGAATKRSVNGYLREQIEGALQEHRVMHAYRLILNKALINKDIKQVCDAWRVYHSLAFQLEYIQTINMDLQALVKYALTFPVKLVKVSSSQLLSKGRGKNKTETDPIRQSPFNTTTLAKFIGAYSDKVTSILQEPCAFVPPAFLELIQEKLKTVVEVGSQTETQDLIIDNKTLTTLREIFQLLQPVQDWTSDDAHQAITVRDHGYI